MIKNFLITNSMNSIKDLNKYSAEQLDEIRYGIESIYLAFTKVFIILLISFIIGLFKESIIFLLIFNLIRLFAFGLHASKSIYCWIASIISFIGIPFICKYIVFPNTFFIILSIICINSIIIFAPADTIKRPLINKKKRNIYKILSSIISIFYVLLIFTIKNQLYRNLLMFALILEVILILPLTYKLFKLPYNNYKNYKN